jgi:hypothetical protein
MDSADLSPEAAVRDQRVRNWTVAMDVLSGARPRPRRLFPVRPVEEIRARVADSPNGLITLSAHYSTYFLLLDLASELDRDFVVMTSPEGVAMWQANAAVFPSRVRFVSAIGAADLRACQRRACTLFFMADTIVPRLANAYLPFLGRMTRLTLSWARIATRYGFDILPVVAHHRNEALEVRADYLPAEPGADAYGLAARALSRIETFMGDDLQPWEHQALFAACPPLPTSYKMASARQELVALAACDLSIRRALMTLLDNGARP